MNYKILFIFSLLILTIHCNIQTPSQNEEPINIIFVLFITLIIIFLAFVFRYLNLNSSSQEKDTFPLNIKYLFKDKPITSESEIPIFDSLIHEVSGSKIYGTIFAPPTKENKIKHPVLIFLHGFPGFATFDDLAHALCRSGCIVIIPKHRGAWGSQGKYTLSNCIEDAENLVNYVKSAEFEKYNPDIKNIFLMGHSMGGHTVVHAAEKINPVIKGIILIAPADVVALSKNADDKKLGEFFIENGSDILNIISIESLIKETRENWKDFCESVNNNEKLKKINVFAAVGDYDDVTPGNICVDPMFNALRGIKDKEKNNNVLIKKTYKTKHGFIGVRINLIRDIMEYINKCYNI